MLFNWQEHYRDLKDKSFYPKLTNYITSGPVVCMVYFQAYHFYYTKDIRTNFGFILGSHFTFFERLGQVLVSLHQPVSS